MDRCSLVSKMAKWFNRQLLITNSLKIPLPKAFLASTTMAPFALLKKQDKTLFRPICCERKTLFRLKKTSWKVRIIREAIMPMSKSLCIKWWRSNYRLALPSEMKYMYAYIWTDGGCAKAGWFHTGRTWSVSFLIGVVVFSTWKSSSLTATTKKSATYIPRFVSSRGCTLIDDCPLP